MSLDSEPAVEDAIGTTKLFFLFLLIFLPQEFVLEVPFLPSWDFTVFFTTASTSPLEGSPIKVLTMAQVAYLQYLTGTGVSNLACRSYPLNSTTVILSFTGINNLIQYMCMAKMLLKLSSFPRNQSLPCRAESIKLESSIVLWRVHVWSILSRPLSP